MNLFTKNILLSLEGTTPLTSLKSFHDLASKFPINPLIKLTYVLLKTLFLLRTGEIFILFLFLIVILVTQLRRWLKARMDKQRPKVKNIEIYSSSTASHCWSNNHHFGFIKTIIASSSISSEHFNLYEKKILTISTSFLCLRISDTRKLFILWYILVQGQRKK